MLQSVNDIFVRSKTELTPCMEEEFFSSLMMRNGTYKTTYRDRFMDVNSVILDLLRRNEITAGSILDIGVSSGISTLELHAALARAGFATRITATDLFMDASVVNVLPACYATVDDHGFPLRFDVFNRGVKPWVAPRDYRTGFFIIRKAMNATFVMLANGYLRRQDQRRISRIKLVTPRLAGNQDIVMQRDDISQPRPEFKGVFDFVRAANVLNRAYFSVDELSGMIENIRSYMRGDGSSFLVVRTDESHVNAGTFFRMGRSRRFEVVHRFGTGSEIEALVLSAAGV